MISPAESEDVQIGSGCFEGQEVVARLSRQVEDPAWELFLRGTPLGQYQQSSLWARAKRTEGWNLFRVRATADDRIVGGFQILWRPAKLWRIGYISKGPVAQPEHPLVSEFLVDALRTAAKIGKLSALIIEPPDLSKVIPATLPRDRFLPNVLVPLIEATLVVDVSGPMEVIEERISTTTRRLLRQSLRRGAVVREGRREDLGLFFDLMLATCRRQGKSANPGNVEFLHELWDAAHPADSIRLAFAEHQGGKVAGMISLSFGDTVTAWKKGWNGSAGDCRPNELLNHDAIQWAHARGSKFVDFASMQKSTALAILRGEALTKEQTEGYDYFNIRFGGQPRLLPDSLIYFPNWFFRSVYTNRFFRAAYKNRFFHSAYKLFVLRTLRKKPRGRPPQVVT